jgi:NTE family protein
MIALLRQVANPGNSEGAMWAKMRVHLVRNEIMSELGYSSKLNAEWEFISMLCAEGRRAADVFLTANSTNLGKRSSVDLDVLLQGV